MTNKLKNIQTQYIDSQTLLTLFSAYKKPREAILRSIDRGELIRLKNSIYLINEKIQSEEIHFAQIANFLYGPSYVSMEWALSFYGMIPERVHTITSMTLQRNKEFHTPVGDFTYSTLPIRCYSIGMTRKNSTDLDEFLIASPEKALADLVFKRCKNINREQLRKELLESRRIDSIHFQSIDKELLEEIAECYHAKSIYHLRDLVGGL